MAGDGAIQEPEPEKITRLLSPIFLSSSFTMQSPSLDLSIIPLDWSIGEPRSRLDQLINQSTTQSINQSIHKPDLFILSLDWSIRDPRSRSIIQPINQSNNQPLNQSTNSSINQSIHKPDLSILSLEWSIGDPRKCSGKN